MPRLFCFGYGFSASTLANKLAGGDWTVSGTCRGAEKAAAMTHAGIDPVLFAPEQPLGDIDSMLTGVTHLLISIPPDDDGDRVLTAYGADFERLASQFDWVGYLSTTGVYGDLGGDWVDEYSPLAPTSKRGERRLKAENAWFGLHGKCGLPVHVFRLPGIYGPGRNAFENLKAGTAKRIDKPGQVFSRVHVEDIAGGLAASIAKPDPGRIYNLCDDLPAAPRDVIEFAAGLMGIDPPPLVPFESADLSPMARSFYADSKQVSNARIKQELNLVLKYPTYREGLRALFEEFG